MTSTRTPSEWWVHGYWWIRAVPADRTEGRNWAAAEGSWALTAANSDPAWRVYNPLHEHPGLFKTFAHTPPTREGILHFAHRYGLLGLPLTLDRVSDGTCIQGEWLEQWQRHIRAVALTLELHIALDNNDDVALRAVHPPWMDLCLVLFEECILPTTPGYVMQETQAGVVEIYPDGPEGAAQVRHTLANVLTGAVKQLSFRVVAARNAFAFVMVPDTLIAAIWYQVAQAVTGHKDFRRCQGPGCDGWIEISLGPTGSKSSKRYCSHSCKMKTYRTRQHDARTRKQAGQSLREIARDLNTDTRTVKRWLAPRPRTT